MQLKKDKKGLIQRCSHFMIDKCDVLKCKIIKIKRCNSKISFIKFLLTQNIFSDLKMTRRCSNNVKRVDKYNLIVYLFLMRLYHS